MEQKLPHIFDSDPPGKARILGEGLRLFARKGLSGTSIRDIAKATELSNPALYKHFKTKDELAIVLFERLYRSHLLRLEKAISGQPDFPSRFRIFLEIRLRAFDEQPDAAIFSTDNLVTLWSKMPKHMRDRTILSVLKEVLQLGRLKGFVDANAELTLQVALVVGLLENVTRQIYFGDLPRPAINKLDEIDHLLRKALC